MKADAKSEEMAENARSALLAKTYAFRIFPRGVFALRSPRENAKVLTRVRPTHNANSERKSPCKRASPRNIGVRHIPGTMLAKTASFPFRIYISIRRTTSGGGEIPTAPGTRCRKKSPITIASFRPPPVARARRNANIGARVGTINIIKSIYAGTGDSIIARSPRPPPSPSFFPSQLDAFSADSGGALLINYGPD